MATSHLKHFAHTDGLLKGTALISNLITTACISILPGFGAAGLFIANTVQMTVSGLLEVPTGYLADRFGWNRSVKLALCLKIFVTLSFLAAILAAKSGNHTWIWIFITMEALVDSFACAFLSGAYQAAYLDWYEKRLENDGTLHETAPPLFLSSFGHGLKIRFAMPLVVMMSIFILNLLSRHYGVVDPYAVAFISIGIIFILRTLVLARIYRDLKSTDSRYAKEPSPFKSPSLKTFRGIVCSPYLPIYVTAIAINLFAIFFLIAQLFKLFNASGLTSSLVWATGILFGIAIYLVRTWLGVIFFPKLAALKGNKGALFVSVVLGCILLVGGAVVTLNPAFWIQLPALLLLAIASATLTDAIQNSIDSRLSEVVEKQYRATWLSVANALGMLFFGLLSYLIIRFQCFQAATGYFCLVYFAALIASAICLGLADSSESLPRFSSVIGRMLVKSTAALVVVFFAIDVLNFTFVTLQIQRRNEQTVSKLVLNAVEEPLLQGSFVEANRRLQRLKDDGSFLCAHLKAWEFSAELCDRDLTTYRLTDEVKQDIYLSDSSNHRVGDPIGKVSVYFDRAHIWNAILSRIIFSTLFFTFCALGLLYLLRKLGAKIEKELDHVVHLVEKDTTVTGAAMPGTVTIREFSIIGEKLKDILRLKKEMAWQEGMTQLATQVSHDIRSPLTAIKIISGNSASMGERNRKLITDAVERIREITNPLLVKHREHLAVISSAEGEFDTSSEPKKSVSAPDLLQLIATVVSEEKLREPSSQINIWYDLERSARELSALVVPSQLKRVVSSLLRNSIEAIEEEGTVGLLLRMDDHGSLLIEIVDDGKGIPEHILEKLGNRGESYGKGANGNGLGVWYAKRVIETWGGEMNIQSRERIGTQVRIKLATSRSTP